ncbi:MAG: hypothetical protein WAW31_00035 [Smithella sp.]
MPVLSEGRNLVKRNISVNYIIILGFITGIIIRILMLFYKGTFDMDAYFIWGNRTLSLGLNDAYTTSIKSYFPLQHQLFSIASYWVHLLKIDYWVVYKAFNLIFDIGTFVLLYNILSKLKINPTLTLFYWLHPWFLIIYSLGYIDSQFAFLVLLSILILLSINKNVLTGFIIAGIPIGFAFLLKPQVQALILIIGLLSVFYYRITKKFETFGLLAFSCFLFVVYTIYFFIYSNPVYFLAQTYLATSNIMPCINAQMLNIWYPIAYIMRPNNFTPIYRVSDQITILSFISIKFIAVLITIGSMLIFTNAISKQMKEKYFNSIFILLFGFSFFALPFLMTSAHENHFFMASILLLIISFKVKDLLFKISVQTTLILQFLNISLLYSEDFLFGSLRNLFIRNMAEIGLVLTLISLPFLIYIFLYFYTLAKNNPFLQDLNEKKAP